MSDGLTIEQTLELGKTVTTVLSALHLHLEKFNAHALKAGEDLHYSLPSKEIQERCVKALSSQLSEHVKTYSIHQTRIDFFKVAAWLGIMLYKSDPKSFLLVQLVTALNAQLSKEGRKLPSDVCKKIAFMLKNDGEKDSVAIGMNGLYMIFRSASVVKLR